MKRIRSMRKSVDKPSDGPSGWNVPASGYDVDHMSEASTPVNIDSPTTPIRTLHVLDPANPHVGPCVCQLVADSLPKSTGATSRDVTKPHDEVLLVGGTTAERIAHRTGLRTFDRISAVGGKPWMSIFAFRKYLAHLGPFEILQTWSLDTFALVTLAAPTSKRVLYLSTFPETSSMARWLRTLQGSAAVLAVSNSIKRAWVELGGIEPSRIQVLRPGLSFNRVQEANRVRVRKQWGITDNDTFVMTVLAHPNSLGSGKRGVRFLTLTHMQGRKVALVLPSGMKDEMHAFRLAKSVPPPGPPIIIDDTVAYPWESFAACDAGIMLCNDICLPGTNGTTEYRSTASNVTGVLPLHWAAACGLTIVGEAGYAVSEIIEHGHSGFLAMPNNDHDIVRRIDQAIQDPQRNWGLRDAARSEAFSYFSRSRFTQDLKVVWQQLIKGAPIEVPELPTTGGLRFAGRA